MDDSYDDPRWPTTSAYLRLYDSLDRAMTYGTPTVAWILAEALDRVVGP